MHNRAGGLMHRRLAILPLLTFLVGGAFLPPMAAGATGAEPGMGTLVVCKSGTHGMSGRTFQFSVDGAALFAVVGGACSDSISTASTRHTVTELDTGDTAVLAVRGQHIVNKALADRTVTVRVLPDTVTAEPTRITFINELTGGSGLLKVCKAGGDASLVGEPFGFTENGGPTITVLAGTPVKPTCSIATAYPIGAVVSVAELESVGTAVSAITVSDGRGSNIDIGARTVNVTIGPDVTKVVYTNVPNRPLTGYVSICKTAAPGDAAVMGDFQFAVTAGLSSDTKTVAVGTCSEPFVVASGDVTVKEVAQDAFYVKSISVLPADHQVSADPAARTVVLGVPVGDDPNQPTVASFQNASAGRVSICKTLTAGSDALVGTSSTFDVSTSAAGDGTLSVVVGAPGTTVCKPYPVSLPVGSTVSITERGAPGVQVAGVAVSPVANDNGSTSTAASIKVGLGITTATFTNRATGTVEICVTAASTHAGTLTFQFTVNGSVSVSVHAGQCSLAQTVPVGTATIYETPIGGVVLQSVAASGNRLTSGPTANPATVSVPLGGSDNATVVTFTNA